ncbi:MAG: pyoverdine biosynthesis protein PvdO [Thermodesulfobacteriota bacterium]|nr:MAG: pyoverdine biosynthesis protein PvdO [Thermodesulfobacteriota bacterium]
MGKKKNPTIINSIKDAAFAPALVVLPTGEFMMGSPDEEIGHYPNESPQHRVNIASFAIGQFPVTRREYSFFLEDSKYKADTGCYCWRGGRLTWCADTDMINPGFEQDDLHPAVCISWDDAMEYVSWLSKKTNLPYRLPTESEWEYAARATTTSSRFWGETPEIACEYANVSDLTRADAHGLEPIPEKLFLCHSGYVYTSPVGKFRANGFGLYDVLGNVWEFVADKWHDSYTGAPSDGSAWLDGGSDKRIIRGASWFNVPRNVRSANRYSIESNVRYSGVGLRVARNVE